jgi:3-phenylpropionate/trans-cinnamate dioxygenase ferredoxin reductase subunit
MNRIVIVGAGLAGMKTVEALRTAGYDGEVTLLGAEPHQPYDRPPLSKQVLRGEREPVYLRAPELMGHLQVDLRVGVTATALHDHAVELDTGDRVAFDQAVIATGAAVRTLPGVRQLAGVHYLRTLEDCLGLRSALQPATRVVIVGGGFIGCEVAASARAMGADVTVVEPQPQPLAGPLGPELATELLAAHREHGVTVLPGVGVESVAGTVAVDSVRLTDGTVLPAQVVVVGVGVRPDIAWLAESGVALDDGVVTDEHLLSAQPGVYAVGDVARWYDTRTGVQTRAEHWTNATEMAEVAAANLLGGQAVHSPVPYFWSDQYDLKVQSLGWTSQSDERRVLTVGPKSRRVVLYGRGGALWGVAGVNAAAIVRRQHEPIAAHAPLEDVAADLLAS